MTFHVTQFQNQPILINIFFVTSLKRCEYSYQILCTNLQFNPPSHCHHERGTRIPSGSIA